MRITLPDRTSTDAADVTDGPARFGIYLCHLCHLRITSRAELFEAAAGRPIATTCCGRLAFSAGLGKTNSGTFGRMLWHIRIITLPIALLAFGTVRAQGLAPMDSTVRRNELSVDVTGFIRQFVPNNSEPLGYPYYYQPTYLLSYKRSCSNGALRFGAGGDYALQSDTGGYNSHTNYTNYDWRLYLRAGWERRWSLNRRWSCYAGFDGQVGIGRGLSHNITTQAGKPDVHSTYKSYGAGPVLGIQFHLNRRIALFTEASLYWIYQETGQHYDYPEDENDVKSLSTNGTILFAYPIAVWFAVAF